MTDNFLVVGGGLAGLSFALRTAEKTKVTIVTKETIMDSNSSLAQGGIAAVMRAPDSYQKHINDTLKVGQGLSDIEAVETLVHRGSEEIRWLKEQGVEFSEVNGLLDLTREGGHSSRRVVHAEDITGYEVQKTLVDNANKNPNIKIIEGIIGIDLIIKNEACKGLRALNKDGSLIDFIADNTVLATGGVGQLYSKTSNPLVATGDGVAMAWRAGAVLKDLEFVQFHPSILDQGESPFFLISEAVRGEGGVLVNAEGEAFMTRYHPLQDLAPRDVVSRAIVEEQKKGQVYIDIRERGKEYLVERFPGIYAECLNRGIMMDEDLIPVTPAAHYFCGGVKVNKYGETNIPGLLVFGESSCTGVHGANRLASNSTLECLVFSSLSAEKVVSSDAGFPEEIMGNKVDHSSAPLPRDRIQRIMWDYVGINRDIKDLANAIKTLDEIYHKIETQFIDTPSYQLIETRNLACLARLIARAAYTRHESRGTHMLSDYPIRDDVNWLKHIEFKKENVIFADHI